MDAEIRCVRCRVVFSSTDVVIGLDSSVTPDIASGNRKLEIHMDGYGVNQDLSAKLIQSDLKDGVVCCKNS
jgi:hypothetical protein